MLHSFAIKPLIAKFFLSTQRMSDRLVLYSVLCLFSNVSSLKTVHRIKVMLYDGVLLELVRCGQQS